jgi:predicted Zn-dependent protease
MNIKSLPTVLGVSVLLLTAAAVRAQDMDLGDFNLISVQDEIEMGKEMKVEVEKEHPLLRDSQVQRYVGNLGKKLAGRVTNSTGIPLSVSVVKDDEVNAFTIPGGYIYVNSGLIKRLDSEAELAGVIAHEMGHAVRRDGTKQLSRLYGMSLLLNIVLGSNAPQWQQIAGDLFSTVGLLAYGRSAEYAADKSAVRTSLASGYDPNAYLTFLRKLQEMGRDQPNLLTELFSTHPETSGRISIVEGEIAALSVSKKRLVTNTVQFDTIKRRVR